MTLDVQDSQYESGGASKTIAYLSFTASSYRYTFISHVTYVTGVMIMRPQAPQQCLIVAIVG